MLDNFLGAIGDCRGSMDFCRQGMQVASEMPFWFGMFWVEPHVLQLGRRGNCVPGVGTALGAASEGPAGANGKGPGSSEGDFPGRCGPKAVGAGAAGSSRAAKLGVRLLVGQGELAEDGRGGAVLRAGRLQRGMAVANGPMQCALLGRAESSSVF